MPTYRRTERFWREFNKLPSRQREAFLEAREAFIEDADTSRFRPSLRVKPVQSAKGGSGR